MTDLPDVGAQRVALTDIDPYSTYTPSYRSESSKEKTHNLPFQRGELGERIRHFKLLNRQENRITALRCVDYVKNEETTNSYTIKPNSLLPYQDHKNIE